MTSLFFQRYSYSMTKTYWLLAVFFIALEAVDGFFTMWATNHGFIEVNRLAAPVAGSWLFPTWKIGGAILGILILIPVMRFFPKLVEFGLVLASIFLTGVLISNIVSLVS